MASSWEQELQEDSRSDEMILDEVRRFQQPGYLQKRKANGGGLEYCCKLCWKNGTPTHCPHLDGKVDSLSLWDVWGDPHLNSDLHSKRVENQGEQEIPLRPEWGRYTRLARAAKAAARMTQAAATTAAASKATTAARVTQAAATTAAASSKATTAAKAAAKPTWRPRPSAAPSAAPWCAAPKPAPPRLPPTAEPAPAAAPPAPPPAPDATAGASSHGARTAPTLVISSDSEPADAAHGDGEATGIGGPPGLDVKEAVLAVAAVGSAVADVGARGQALTMKVEQVERHCLQAMDARDALQRDVEALRSDVKSLMSATNCLMEDMCELNETKKDLKEMIDTLNGKYRDQEEKLEQLKEEILAVGRWQSADDGGRWQLAEDPWPQQDDEEDPWKEMADDSSKKEATPN